MTAFWASCAVLAIAWALTEISDRLVQRHHRRKAARIAAVRRRECADAQREAELLRVTQERDYWHGKYHTEVGRLIAEVHGVENTTYHLVRWEREMEAGR